MGLEATKQPDDLPLELPGDIAFPEEYIEPTEDIPFDQKCLERAKKASYYRIDDNRPVLELYSDDGTYSQRYGYEDDKWSTDLVGPETFYNEGFRISKKEFLGLVEAIKKSEQ